MRCLDGVSVAGDGRWKKVKIRVGKMGRVLTPKAFASGLFDIWGEQRGRI